MPTSSLIRIRTAPQKNIEISPYEMVYGLPYLGRPYGLLSLKPKSSFSKILFSISLQFCHPFSIRNCWPRLHHWNFCAQTLIGRLHPHLDLERREAQDILGGTLPGVPTETAAHTAKKGPTTLKQNELPERSDGLSVQVWAKQK
jgi:hypothetical protein